MFDASRTLIREWDGRGMEVDGCCCCRGANGFHRHSAVLQLLRHKETRLQRAAHFLAVACVLLTLVALALLVTLVLGARGHHTPDNQVLFIHRNTVYRTHTAAAGLNSFTIIAVQQLWCLIKNVYFLPVRRPSKWF